MDKDSRVIISKIWKHSGNQGFVWTPSIISIGKKDQRFVEGTHHKVEEPLSVSFDKSRDWYFTPAVASENSRKKTSYGDQRVVWVDCDESFDYDKLMRLMPSFVWETSPNHFQAVWLLKDSIPASEFSANGFIGLLTQTIGADKSGVDIGQLLRIPGTYHHKRKPFKGSVVSKSPARLSRGQLLGKVARVLGFTPALSSEISAEDPYGDRSKQLWKFECEAAKLGLPQDLTFKLIKACKWNKWKDNDNRLRADIAAAYEKTSIPEVSSENPIAGTEEIVKSPWQLQTVGDFGRITRKPVDWVIPNLIIKSGCGLIVAPPKVGKTRIAIEVSVGASSGSDPLGVNIRRPLNVGFFSLEDGQYLFSKRLSSSLDRDSGRFPYHWDGHITPDHVWHPPKPLPLLVSFDQIDLSTPEDKQQLLTVISENDLDLVIIDTLSMAVGKNDINNSSEMYAILKDIKTIAKSTECAIVFIHHTRKRVFDKGETIQERVLGSTALHAWSDFILSLAPPEEGSELLRLAVQTKMGGGNYLLDQSLKIVKKPEPVEES